MFFRGKFMYIVCVKSLRDLGRRLMWESVLVQQAFLVWSSSQYHQMIFTWYDDHQVGGNQYGPSLLLAQHKGEGPETESPVSWSFFLTRNPSRIANTVSVSVLIVRKATFSSALLWRRWNQKSTQSVKNLFLCHSLLRISVFDNHLPLTFVLNHA